MTGEERCVWPGMANVGEKGGRSRHRHGGWMNDVMSYDMIENENEINELEG